MTKQVVLQTWNKAESDQSPNQLRTQRLNRAGEVAARSFKPFSLGFMVKTTWRFFMTWWVNHLYNSSLVSNMRPCL